LFKLEEIGVSERAIVFVNQKPVRRGGVVGGQSLKNTWERGTSAVRQRWGKESGAIAITDRKAPPDMGAGRRRANPAAARGVAIDKMLTFGGYC